LILVEIMKELSGSQVYGRHVERTRNQELLLDVDREKELVASCHRGDRSAYGDLIRAHSGRVFAVCFGILGNRHDAEDAAQQALLKGFMQIRTLRSSDRFAPWIVRIARNLCIDVLRVRKRRGIPSGRPDIHAGDPDEYRRLEQALSGLGEEYRVPLLLFYFDGRSTQSIAETLGVTQANVQTRLSRARKQLRRLLEREGDDR
jgi:RNA polymerase sigma-70 factor (ECF subfamily)